MTTTGRYVCTALIGGYERLTEQPIVSDSQVQFICFTDDPELTSQTWQVRRVEPRFAMDPVRSARDVKVRLDRYLPNAGETLWIDNSVLLLSRPEDLLDAWLAEVDLAVPRHSFRGTLSGEFAEVSVLGLDDVARVFEQVAHYEALDPQVLAEPVLWTGILARRMTSDRVRAFGELWMDHILRYSRRDQLSVNTALRGAGVPTRIVELDNHVSPHHRWPVSEGRLDDSVRRRFRLDFVPDAVARASTEAQSKGLADEVQRLSELLRSFEEERDDLVAEIGRLMVEPDPTGHLVSEADLERLRRAEADLASVLGSRSFRWTEAPRRVAASLRGRLGRSHP